MTALFAFLDSIRYISFNRSRLWLRLRERVVVDAERLMGCLWAKSYYGVH